jgi:hypothetical protein
MHGILSFLLIAAATSPYAEQILPTSSTNWKITRPWPTTTPKMNRREHRKSTSQVEFPFRPCSPP